MDTLVRAGGGGDGGGGSDTATATGIHARLVDGVAALLHHRYAAWAHTDPSLVAFVRAHPRYSLALFWVALAREPSMETFVRHQCPDHGAKVTGFLAALRRAVTQWMDHVVSLETFEAQVAEAWILA